MPEKWLVHHQKVHIVPSLILIGTRKWLLNQGICVTLPSFAIKKQTCEYSDHWQEGGPCGSSEPHTHLCSLTVIHLPTGNKGCISQDNFGCSFLEGAIVPFSWWPWTLKEEFWLVPIFSLKQALEARILFTVLLQELHAGIRDLRWLFISNLQLRENKSNEMFSLVCH